MFRRLIIATDLSEASFAVIERAADLRGQGAEDCLLLLWLGFQEASSLYSISDTAYIDEKLNRQKEMLENYGFNVCARVIPGFARQKISRIVKEEDYSLVITGSRKHTLFGEKLMENLAFDIIHHVSHPVLIVRLQEQKIGEEVEIVPQASELTGHVLHPTDFSENADRAFSYVEEMVEAGVKKVSLLHVQDSSTIERFLKDKLDEFNRTDLGRLELMKKRLLVPVA